MSQEMIIQSGGDKANHGRPLVRLPNAVGDLELHSRIPAADGLRPTSQGELAFFRLAEIYPDQGSQGLREDCVVSTGIQEAVAESRVPRAGQADRQDRARSD